jgi:hypothetical protein
LTFTVTNSNTDVVNASIVNGALRLVLVPDASGVATITVRAVDNAGNAIEDSFDISVSPMNDAPRVVDDLFYLTPQGVELRTTDARGTATPSIFAKVMSGSATRRNSLALAKVVHMISLVNSEATILRYIAVL